MIHGGPTSAARNVLALAKQFWTSRGFAVVDVNYGGSTGYGRPYRDLLQGRWGIVDVEDAVAAAEHLAGEGLVDGDQLAIRGGSAGGYTTLAALCFHHVFKAGASHYGVADLSALAADTHKFESRYLDGLVGPYPEDQATYDARSPDPPHRRLLGPADRAAGERGRGGPARPGRDDRVGPGRQGDPARLPAVRGRAARLPPGREHHPGARGRAVVLRPGVRLRPPPTIEPVEVEPVASWWSPGERRRALEERPPSERASGAATSGRCA